MPDIIQHKDTISHLLKPMKVKVILEGQEFPIESVTKDCNKREIIIRLQGDNYGECNEEKQ